MCQVVKLKDGSYGTVIREFSWKDFPDWKIYKDSSYKERLFYEDFVEVELNAERKGNSWKYAEPMHSTFYKVQSIVCQKDVEYVYLTKE